MVNLKQVILKKFCEKNLFYSFELNYHKNSLKIYEKFLLDTKALSPLFYSFASHSTNNDRITVSLLKNFMTSHNNDILLHLIARGLTKFATKQLLDEALSFGVTNVLIVRGDDLCSVGDFNYAIDLIRFIKNEYNDKIGIAVAGYPDKHPESQSKQNDLNYLKQKVDAGADWIITQIIFDSQSFINFVHDCQNYGINVPIIAGLMPIISYTSVINMIKKCKLNLAPYIYNDLKKWKDNDIFIHEYGVKLITTIIQEIIANKCSYGFHFFTLNQSLTINEICKQIK